MRIIALTTAVCATLVVSGASIYGLTRDRLATDATCDVELTLASEPPKGEIYGIGYVEPVTGLRKLSFPTGGRIARWHVKVGQRVTAGTPIADLERHEIHAEIALAQQQVAAAKAEQRKLLTGAHPSQIEAAEHHLAICRERLRLAESEYLRYAKLPANTLSRLKFERSVSERDQASLMLKKASAELLQLQQAVQAEDRALWETRVAVAESALEHAKQKLVSMTIVAPCDGTVLERLRRVGESVSGVTPEPVVVFADTNALQLRVEVDERFVADLQIGARATVFGRGLGSREVPGRVRMVRQLMGKKTVFSRAADERKELEVVQLIVDTDEPLMAPIGLQLDVRLESTNR